MSIYLQNWNLHTDSPKAYSHICLMCMDIVHMYCGFSFLAPTPISAAVAQFRLSDDELGNTCSLNFVCDACGFSHLLICIIDSFDPRLVMVMKKCWEILIQTPSFPPWKAEKTLHGSMKRACESPFCVHRFFLNISTCYLSSAFPKVIGCLQWFCY